MRSPLTQTMTRRLQQGLDTAKRLGAAAAKLSFHHEERTTCKFEAGRLKDTGGQESLSYHIEALVDGRTGRAFGNRLDDLDAMIEQAVTLAKVGSAAHFDAYPPPGNVMPVKTHSEKTLALTREQMIDACQQITEAIRKYHADVHVMSWANRSESESLVVTSGGVCHPGTRTHWDLATLVQRTEGTDMVMIWYGRDWCDLNAFYDPAAVADRLITNLRLCETIVEPPVGKVPAYLPPETLKRFLEAVFLGTNGRNVAKGDSPLADRLNERVLDGGITIIDDPHRDYASGACEIDADGIPTRKQTLFENGVLRRFLYDLDSAGLAGAEPTGNSGSRPYSAAVLPGPRPSEELLRGIDDGIYIRGMMGFAQSNIINGDFACNVSPGYRIRNGRIVGRVKNTMVAGNLYELLARNVQMSGDLDHEGRYPHAVIEGVSVSARQS